MYTSLLRLLIQEIECSRSTVKYAERRTFLDLWIVIISFYLNLDENIWFILYLSSTGGPFLLSVGTYIHVGVTRKKYETHDYSALKSNENFLLSTIFGFDRMVFYLLLNFVYEDYYL